MTTRRGEHTPGPWEAKDWTDAVVIEAVVQDEDGDRIAVRQIASLSHRKALPYECLANACLIAAAPDLLSALESLRLGCLSPVDVFENCGSCRTCAARAAIAKAKGER